MFVNLSVFECLVKFVFRHDISIVESRESFHGIHMRFCFLKGKSVYGGIAVDAEGRILGTRTDKGRSIIQVLKMGGGKLLSEIDSHSSKLRRPTGIAILPDNHLVVVDLGNDCVKKYRYW